MVADVAHGCLVLKNDNEEEKAGLERACQSTNISHQVKYSVNLALYDHQVPAQLVCQRQLNIIIEVVEALFTSFNFIYAHLFFLEAERADFIRKLQLGYL